jgi:hypothetical protein
VVVSSCNPNNLFVECVTIFTMQITGLIWVGLVEWHVVFPALRMFLA